VKYGVGPLAIVLAAAGLVVTVLAAGGTQWSQAFVQASDPAVVRDGGSGPVMVLGGAPERVRVALALSDVPSESRPLVLSASAATFFERSGRSCAEPHVLCVSPVPENTYGESLLAGRLMVQHGWGELTVVTSRFHVARTRWQFGRCVASVRDGAVPAGVGQTPAPDVSAPDVSAPDVSVPAVPVSGVSVVVVAASDGPVVWQRAWGERAKLVNALLRYRC
jgi:hypothetical protein